MQAPARAPSTDAPAAPLPQAVDPPSSGSTAQTCPNCDTLNVADALFCEACGYDFTTGVMPRPIALTDGSFLTPVESKPGPTADPGSKAEDPPEPDAIAEPQAAPEAQPVSEPEHAPAVRAATPTDTPASPASADPAPTNSPASTPSLSFPSGKMATYRPPSRESAKAWVTEVWIDPDWYAVQDSTEPCPSPGVPEIVPLRDGALIGRPSASRRIHPDIDVGTDTGVSRRQAVLTTDGHRWWVEDLDSSNGTFVGPASGPLPDDPITSRVEVDADDRIYVGAWTRLVVRPATDSERAGHG